MRKYDRISSLVWVFIGLAICLESIHLGPGTLSKPSPGFLPLICGSIMGIIGIIIFIMTFSSLRCEEKVIIWKPGTRWGAMILTVSSLVVYALLINIMGFYIMTVLWVIFLCRVVSKMRWTSTILASVLIAGFNYIVISHYLGVRFPAGMIFGS